MFANFLSVQSIFAAGSAGGYLLLINNPTSISKTFLSIGLTVLAIFNILLCLFWLIKNKGLQAWSRTATMRELLIEADPLILGIIGFSTTIFRQMRNTEGVRSVPLHGTGDIESWGPPIIYRDVDSINLLYP